MAAKKKRHSRKKSTRRKKTTGKKKTNRKAASSKKPTPAFAFIEAQLRKNKKATYQEIRDAGAKKGLDIAPILYGRVKALLGLVPMKKRGSKKKKAGRRKAAAAKGTRRPGRKKGSTVAGSKSERIRELLGSGMSAAEIARKVGCSPNLVYVVRSNSGASSRKGPGRPRKTARSAGNLDGLAAAITELQRERDRMRDVLVRIRELLERVV